MWISLYEKTGNASLTCWRCGISKPTLRKWWKRYQAQGPKGLNLLYSSTFQNEVYLFDVIK